ncbi:MAG: PIN domain-containing protein [Proteobacteria bacterium]|nr:PIN domain-containing protein [Pseudomonadota bacterium]
MRFVLDSNMVIAALNGRASVVEHLARIAALDVGIPVVVVGELVYGAHRSRRKRENLGRIARLTRSFRVLNVNRAIVERYGAIRAALQSKGITKSDFDLVIACTALEHEAVLVTDDGGLLDGSVQGLRVDNWLERARGT